MTAMPNPAQRTERHHNRPPTTTAAEACWARWNAVAARRHREQPTTPIPQTTALQPITTAPGGQRRRAFPPTPAACYRGAVNLLRLPGVWAGSGRGGLRGLGQAAVAVPGDLLPSGESVGHLASVLLGAESVAPGRKCGNIPLNADKNRWACPGEVNRFIARSRCLVG